MVFADPFESADVGRKAVGGGKEEIPLYERLSFNRRPTTKGAAKREAGRNQPKDPHRSGSNQGRKKTQTRGGRGSISFARDAPPGPTKASAAQPTPRLEEEETAADSGSYTGGASIFEDAALPPASEKLLRDMFGKWTREEAVRASDRAEMLRASIREDLKADLGAIVRDALRAQREQPDEKLHAYAPIQELQKLSDRVDAISVRLSTMAPSPPTAEEDGAPVTHKGEKPRGTSYVASMPGFTAESRSRHQPSIPQEEDVHPPAHESQASSRTVAEAATPKLQHDGQATTSSLTAALLNASSWMGTYEEGLTELQPADGRFTRVMSYRRYRLLSRASQRGPEVSRNLGIWVRRLSHVMNRN